MTITLLFDVMKLSNTKSNKKIIINRTRVINHLVDGLKIKNLKS